MSLSIPKNGTYHKNGSGRDSYIAFNNGGFYRSPPIVIGSYERGQIPWKRERPSQNLPILGKMKQYHIDGTGRDTYIGYNCGGFSASESEGSTKQSFISSLRQYQPVQRQRVQSHYFIDNSKDMSVRQQRSRNHSIEQKETVDRLSIPKKSEDPYTPYRLKTNASVLNKNYSIEQ